MVARAGGRIGVMAGAGLTAENVAGLVAATGVDEVHASCSRLAGSRAVPDFDPPGGRRETGVDEVRAMVAAVAQPS
jgi:copper homeostasis protein